ncbi:MAG: exodeoxyribonuclease VII small subunit [Lachnospiraceae bacterium]
MEDKKETFQLEHAFQEIEQIIGQLESDQLSLKESIDLYGKGVKLVANCKEELAGIEKEMIIIGETITNEDE